MKKIGEYWVPDADAAQGYALHCSRRAYLGNKGVQVDALYQAFTHLTRFGTAIDGGANVGSWSIVMSERFNNIHAFEPVKQTFECLQRNILERDLVKRVACHRKALSDREEDLVFAPLSSTNRTVTYGVSEKGPNEDDLCENVFSTTIDNLNLSDCDLIKLDLEGHEYKALLGARRTVDRFKPAIILEVKGQDPLKTDSVKLLRSWGYKPITILGSHGVDWLFAPDAYEIRNHELLRPGHESGPLQALKRVLRRRRTGKSPSMPTYREPKGRSAFVERFESGLGIELGVAGGYFSNEILNHSGLERLYSVDIWMDHHDSDEYVRCVSLLSKHGTRSVVMRMDFHDAIIHFPDEFFDFIYTDAYAGEGQQRGGLLHDWWPKLKRGGVFAGHDYDPKWQATIDAVDGFCASYGLRVKVIPGAETENPHDNYASWYVEKPKC